LAFYSPAWPPGNDSNGVVTYVGTIVPELEAQGHVISVVSGTVAPSMISDAVYRLSDYEGDRTLPERIGDRLGWLKGRDYVLARTASRLIAAATRRAVAERGVQLLEMEETFGWCFWVRRTIPVPLVLRLHGPWFLTGPAEGHPCRLLSKSVS